MAQGFQLIRPRPARNVISLAPMIDVMLILLVFFMVTSTYLNLDMIPAVAPAPETAEPAPDTNKTPPVIITISADGTPLIQGKSHTLADLSQFLAARVAADPTMQVVLLPSGGAQMQALIGVLDTATAAGATRVRIVRFEAQP